MANVLNFPRVMHGRDRLKMAAVHPFPPKGRKKAKEARPAREGWQAAWALRQNGEPYCDERNVRIALDNAPELAGAIQYNEFHDRVELVKKIPGMKRTDLEEAFGDSPDPITWADDHVTLLQMWLQEQGMATLRKSIVQDAVISVAKQASYHPVREYLIEAHDSWDGEARLDHWLKYYLDAQDDEAYLAAVGAKFLLGAVARVMDPGAKVDNILVLEGAQGRGKSTAVEKLAKGWSHDVTGDLSSKDAAILIRGTWIAELGELASFKRSDQESIKGFLSRRVDHYRPPYGRNAIDAPRQTVFIATTNETDYLQDPTGARRFWPVECGHIDTTALEVDVDQLWGEAVSRYRANERWHLDETQARRAAVQQRARQRTTMTDDLVLEYADAEVKAGRTSIDMRSLLQAVFDLDPKEDPAKAGGIGRLASQALIRDGWKKLKPKGRGANRRQCYEWNGAENETSAAL